MIRDRDVTDDVPVFSEFTLEERARLDALYLRGQAHRAAGSPSMGRPCASQLARIADTLVALAAKSERGA